MKSSLWAAPKSLELGTLTVARLGQPTEVAGEWRPPLPSTPTRCSGCRGSFPSRAPKEGSQRGAVTTLCTWRRSSSSCCRAAQQEKPAELAGREPPVQEVAGTVLRHDWVPLGPTERPPGARQTCFWALFQRSRANHSQNEPPTIKDEVLSNQRDSDRNAVRFKEVHGAYQRSQETTHPTFPTMSDYTWTLAYM